MKTQISLSKSLTKMEKINEMEMADKIIDTSINEIEKMAENYANSILRYVHRRELYNQYCGGTYYA